MMMRRITAIMPLYNRSAFVGQALDSLIKQSEICSLSIIVVNDGSTDDSPQIVKNLMSSHPFISIVSTENQGVTKARNTGLRAVKEDTEFITFLDSDDVMTAGRLAQDLAVFDSHPDTEFIYGKMTLVDELDENGMPTVSAKQATVRGISLSAGIYRKRLIERIGFFDETLKQSEDTDYLLRIFETGLPYVLTDAVGVYYRRHPGNMTRDTKTARHYIMLATKRALDRRKADPSIVRPANIFDLTNLIGVEIG
jgi:glycosyltransferase involved in cell wall biosynthesis